LITAKPAPAKAGGGGSNGSRVRLWKRELQKLANELVLDIVVSHLPPGTSKWNKIQHASSVRTGARQATRQLSRDHRAVSATTTKTGLTVRCELDTPNTPRHCHIRRRDGRHQHQPRRVPR
jgi:hypothetical protein